MFKRQKDGKMVATEHWVNISSFHNRPFLDDKSVVGPQVPKDPTSNIYLDWSEGSRTCYIKSPLMYTIQIEFAGTKIPKWSMWLTSNLFVNQCKVSSDLWFRFWTKRLFTLLPLLLSPLSKKLGCCKFCQVNDRIFQIKKQKQKP